MRPPPKPSPQKAIIILRQIEPHEWIFELPRLTQEVDDRLDEGIDWLHANLKRAEDLFRELIREYPEHLDAYHHLALALERMGKADAAFQIWEQAVKLALTFFPPHFSMQRERLAWGWVENRPFLRLYHSFGLQLMRRGQTEAALQIFEEILDLNPNDNQGVRALVVGCYFALKQPEGVLSLCRQYREDGMEQLLYGRALALFQVGKVQQAGKALQRAVALFPLIAEELLKTRHGRPKGVNEQNITMGSKEQAYLYWEEQGKYWKHTAGASEFLRSQWPGEKAGGR